MKNDENQLKINKFIAYFGNLLSFF